MPVLARGGIDRRSVFALFLTTAFAVAGGVGGCQTVPETGRTQFVALSAADERQLGAAAYDEQLKDAKLITTGAEYERVQRVSP